VALNSGNAPLVPAHRLLDLQPGDEVILPSYTLIDCVETVVRAGAVPVLCDSQARDFLASEAAVGACISPPLVWCLRSKLK